MMALSMNLTITSIVDQTPPIFVPGDHILLEDGGMLMTEEGNVIIQE
jgi:hypothetical protein